MHEQNGGFTFHGGADADIISLLADPDQLKRHILTRLCRVQEQASWFSEGTHAGTVTSSVLLLLGWLPAVNGRGHRVHLILNERSRKVKQSGDLCCPGGAVEPRLDPLLARLATLPGSQLKRWPCWRRLQRSDSRAARKLGLYWATCLRESWEEMRLNPFKVQFMGVLPPQRLLLFRRVMQPLVGWVKGQEEFVPNWEVSKVVAIPVSDLFDCGRHARYRMYVDPELGRRIHRTTQDFPCFLHQNGPHVEILWGATFRIVLLLLEKLFDFTPPDPETLPIVPGVLDEGYINGRELNP